MMRTLIFLMIFLSAYVGYAQKLPNLQTQSAAVPEAIKVDGDDAEWSGKYAAFNKKLDLYYTLANDDKHIYLLLKSKSDGIELSKLLSGGFQFSIQTQNKKNLEGSFRVSYPIQAASSARPAQFMGTITITNAVRVSRPSNVNMDSIRQVSRTKQLAAAREMKVFGFSAIQDSILSIYNEHDIKVAGKLTPGGDYIYELAIPIKLMGINISEPRTIAYQLRINPIVRNVSSLNSSVTVLNGGSMQVSGGAINVSTGGFNEMLLPTEVWGTLTLNKY